MSEPARFGALREDVDMSRHVSWRAGGVASRVYQPANLADLREFLSRMRPEEPVMAVGLGSNLLVRNGGYKGTVLLMHGALNELAMEADGTIYAQAGIAGAKLARFAAMHGRVGAEFFAGIPGTVGGMLAMNAGCYGGETWRKVARVQVLLRNGNMLERVPAEYEIGYRSVQRRGAGADAEALPQDEIFVGAWFEFEPGDGDAARATIKSLLEKRIASQPLHQPNAGSVFRNPPGDHAARLIESCGLKGRQIGGARVSEKHANFIVNAGGATASDIEDLIDVVRAEVQSRTGILLHPEVRIIGERQ